MYLICSFYIGKYRKRHNQLKRNQLNYNLNLKYLSIKVLLFEPLCIFVVGDFDTKNHKNQTYQKVIEDFL